MEDLVNCILDSQDENATPRTLTLHQQIEAEKKRCRIIYDYFRKLMDQESEAQDLLEPHQKLTRQLFEKVKSHLDYNTMQLFADVCRNPQRALEILNSPFDLDGVEDVFHADPAEILDDWDDVEIEEDED